MTEVQNLKRALNNFHNNHLNIRVSIGPSGSPSLSQIYFCLVDDFWSNSSNSPSLLSTWSCDVWCDHQCQPFESLSLFYGWQCWDVRGFTCIVGGTIEMKFQLHWNMLSWLVPLLMAVSDIGSGGTLIAVLSNHLNPACDLWPNVFRCANIT